LVAFLIELVYAFSMVKRTESRAISATGETRDLDHIADGIEESVNVIAGHLNSQYSQLVDHVVTLLADPRLWRGPGVWTMRQWLAWRTGVSPATARHIVTIAERVEDFPECVATFRLGELSLEQMGAIAKRAPAWTDAQMAGLGTKSTVRQIQRLLATYPFPDDELAAEHRDGGEAGSSDNTSSATSLDDASSEHTTSPDGALDGEAPEDDSPSSDTASADAADGRPSRSSIDEYCSMGWDDDGRFRMSVRADADLGLIIEAALRESRDQLFRSRGSEVTWLDALREVAERSLDSVADPARRQRFKISVFVDTDGQMATSSQAKVPSAIQQRLTCDGSLTPVLLENGLPLSVGHTQRIVPDRTRRIVEHRDQHSCGVSGCNADWFLEIHHIIHWLDGGPTDTWNLICLCPHHHRLHHRGRLGISGNADVPGGVVFTDHRGRPIAGSGATPIPPSGPPPPTIGRYEHPLGERIDTRWFTFREPDRPKMKGGAGPAEVDRLQGTRLKSSS
jgi:hypothetical protein